MSLPKKLFVVTAEYDGEYESAGETFYCVGIFDFAELHTKISNPDIDACITAGEFDESDVDRSDYDNFYETKAWEQAVLEIENWGRNCEVDSFVLDTEAPTDYMINKLTDWRDASALGNVFHNHNIKDHAREVFSQLTVTTKRVSTFLGKEVIKRG